MREKNRVKEVVFLKSMNGKCTTFSYVSSQFEDMISIYGPFGLTYFLTYVKQLMQ